MVKRSTKLILHIRLMALLVAILFIPYAFSADYTDASGLSAAEIISLTNAQRSSQGLPALGTNGKLNQAAQNKANDMLAKGYFNHYTPSGASPFTFISSAGYKYTVAAENLAKGCNTSACVVNGWMGSAGHKANILNTSVTETGAGIASGLFNGVNTTIVVTFYTKPAAAAITAPKTVPAATAKPSAPIQTPAAETKAIEPPVEEKKVEAAAPTEEKRDVVDHETASGDKVMVKSLSGQVPWQIANAVIKISLVLLSVVGGYMILHLKLI